MQARYKDLFNTIIAPLMVLTDIILIGAYWDSNNPQTLNGVIAVVALVIFNLAIVTPIPTPWGVIKTRSETVDVFRWCINLPTSMYIIWCMHITEPAVVTFFILLLTFGAMTEVYGTKHKLITVGMAISCFCFLVFGVYPLELKDKIYITACYVGLVFALWRLERLMFGEMTQYILEEQERRNVEKQAQTLQRDAAIGHHAKAINHELNTLIGIAHLSAFQIETNHNAKNDIEEEMKRLDLSLSHMNRVSSLVLDGLGNKKAVIRRISLKALEDDLRILITRNNQSKKTQLSISFPENAKDYFFTERSGSTYLIIHNLVKNAYEAVNELHEGKPTGKVDIKVELHNDSFTITVSDNGTGMTQQQIDNVRKQLGTTTKLEGHGLGLQFVQSECQKNDMTLDIDSKINSYTVFKITVKLSIRQPYKSFTDQ